MAFERAKQRDADRQVEQMGELAWALRTRLRRYQAPNALHSLNTQPGNPSSGLRSCTCAARATTPAHCATCIVLYPTATSSMPLLCLYHPYAARTDDHRRRQYPIADSQQHNAVATVTPARLDHHSLEVSSASSYYHHYHYHPTIPRQHHIPSITLCILDSTTTATNCIRQHQTTALHSTPCIYIYTSAHWRL